MARVNEAPLKQVLTQMTQFRDEIRAWREEQDDESVKTPDRRRTVESVAMAVAQDGTMRRASREAAAEAAAEDSAEGFRDSLGEEEVPVEILIYRKESGLMEKEGECKQLKEQLLEVQKGMLGGAQGEEMEANQREADRLEAQIDTLNGEIEVMVQEVNELKHA